MDATIAMAAGVAIQASGGARSAAGAAGAQLAGGDGFAGIFFRMMNGMGNEGADPELQVPYWALNGQEKPGSGKSLMEMLAAMMAMPVAPFDIRQFALTDPGGLPLDTAQATAIGSLTADRISAWLAQTGGFAGWETLGSAELEGWETEAGKAMLVHALAQSRAKETQAGTSEGKSDSFDSLTSLMLRQGAGEGQGIPVQMLGYQNRGKTDSEGLFFGQEQFRQAVQAAKGKLSDKDGKTDGSLPGIVLGESAYRTLTSGLMNAQAAKAEEPGVPDQILFGLSQNLPLGKGEFVIKLEPEGLGEITVKLLAKEGRTTLRLITASAETARLINNDIAALQNALRPIRVEVQEAVQESTAGQENNAYYPGFDQFNQFNQYRNQRESDQDSGRSGGPVAGVAREDDVPEIVRGRPPDQDLDMYI